MACMKALLPGGGRVFVSEGICIEGRHLLPGRRDREGIYGTVGEEGRGFLAWREGGSLCPGGKEGIYGLGEKRVYLPEPKYVSFAACITMHQVELICTWDIHLQTALLFSI